MNFASILSEIQRVDPEIYERTSPRRDVIKNWTRRVTLATLPLALGSLFNKAYGKAGKDVVADILQFALTLELLEANFYGKALEATRVNPPATQLIPTTTGLEYPAIKMIWQQELAHVNFISGVLQQMGAPVDLGQNFDFTGGSGTGTGPFAQVFSDYGTFLAVAQMLEDLGVRAYQGEMTVLKSNSDILTAAMRIHSIEARHAAHIRIMRSQTPGPLTDGQDIRPWVTLNQSGINAPEAQAVYNGEENTVQGNNIEVVNISGFDISNVTASQAFDESLSFNDTLDIVKMFLPQ